MIQFDHVRKKYPGGHEALKNVSFYLKKGEMAFLTGHSGAGKTTLLKLIALIETASSGNVFFEQQNVVHIPRRKIPLLRRKIGVIFQNPMLLGDRSVFHNVALPLVVSGYGSADIARRVRASLDQVGLLNREKANPITLSGGEQQRVSIARAIVSKPKVILADEPTGNLDPDLSREIMNLFVRFNTVGVTMLIATHDLELIKQLPHRHMELNAGHMSLTDSSKSTAIPTG